MTDEAISDIVDSRQSFGMTNETYSRVLRRNTLRCYTSISNRRLSFFSIDGLHPERGAKTRQSFSLGSRLDYHTVKYKTKTLDDSVRAARRQAMMALAIGNNNGTGLCREEKTLSVESLSPGSESIRDRYADSEVRALFSTFILFCSRSSLSSLFSSHQPALPPTSKTKTAHSGH